MVTATKSRTKSKSKIQENGLEIESLRPALAEIERMVTYGQLDMGFKNTRITPIIQTQGQRTCYGHYTTDLRWETTDGKGSHELQISAEHLARPAIDIYATIRHELVHAKNVECGIRDCSNNGKYHNAKFKAEAELYGLVCGEKTDSNGHGITRLSAAYQAQVIGELQPDDSAFNLVRQIVQAKKKAKGKMFKWSCGCTNIRAAVEVTAICTNDECGQPFERA
jgi:hypothetical protein